MELRNNPNGTAAEYRWLTQSLLALALAVMGTGLWATPALAACGTPQQECTEGLGKCCNVDCTLKEAGETCRAAVGICDVEEQCDGVSHLCPADVLRSSITVCRPWLGGCDLEETCTGSSGLCPPDVVFPAEVDGEPNVCRASKGECDVDEVCDGVSGACPADAFQASTLECKASEGVCDPAEFCTGSDALCPENALSSGTVCRVATDVCDAVEYCDGTDVDCPEDGLIEEDDHVLCRSEAGVCDDAEYCDGTDTACPEDLYNDSKECRPHAGPCDLEEEYCEGDSIDCPADEFYIPEDEEECREATDDCDAEEYCDGTGPLCPVDAVQPPSHLCRARAGDCDLPESCDGISTVCPVDELRHVDVRCRKKAGPCDVAELCTGVDAACPANVFVGAGEVCKASTGGCDPAEVCSGSSAECPEDVLAASGATCRAANDAQCDLEEVCSGTSSVCPADIYVADDTVCDDGDGATTDDICQAGYCGCAGGDLDGDSVTDNCDLEDAALVVEKLKLRLSWTKKLGSIRAKGSFSVGSAGLGEDDIFDPLGGLQVFVSADVGTSLNEVVSFAAGECTNPRGLSYKCALPSRGGTATFRPQFDEDGNVASYRWKLSLKNVDIPQGIAAPIRLALTTQGIDRVVELSACETKRLKVFLCTGATLRGAE